MLAPATQAPGRVLAECRDYSQLIDALRSRTDELAVSRETLDYLSGLQSGYCAKLLSKEPIRTLSRQSLGPLLTVLGLKLLVAEDPQALARIAPRLERRNAASVRCFRKKRRGPEWAKLMNSMRTLAVPPRRRSQIAQHAALIRWRDLKAAMAELKAKRNGRARG